MAQFKEGDIIRIKEDCNGTKKGGYYRLTKGNSYNKYRGILWAWKGVKDTLDVELGCCCQDNWIRVGCQSPSYKMVYGNAKTITTFNANYPFHSSPLPKGITLTPTGEQNKSGGKIMNKLTSTIKRIFNKSLQAQYKAGLIDDCGKLTIAGGNELDEILRDKFEKELTAKAQEIIKEEKESK